MTPADVLKQRLQLGHHRGLWDAWTCSLKHGGLAGLYRSLPTTLAMNIPYGCVSVAANEAFKAKMKRNSGDKLGVGSLLACGGLAGAVASLAGDHTIGRGKNETANTTPNVFAGRRIIHARLRHPKPLDGRAAAPGDVLGIRRRGLAHLARRRRGRLLSRGGRAGARAGAVGGHRLDDVRAVRADAVAVSALEALLAWGPALTTARRWRGGRRVRLAPRRDVASPGSASKVIDAIAATCRSWSAEGGFRLTSIEQGKIHRLVGRRRAPRSCAA